MLSIHDRHAIDHAYATKADGIDSYRSSDTLIEEPLTPEFVNVVLHPGNVLQELVVARTPNELLEHDPEISADLKAKLSQLLIDATEWQDKTDHRHHSSHVR